MAGNDEPEAAQPDDPEVPRERWDRRPHESPRAHAAFKMWLESEKRSLSDVAQSSTFQCSVANLSRWSRIHDWQGRAWAYDVKREQDEREQLARDRAAMRKRHLRVAAAMQSIAAHGLAELQSRIEQRLPLNMSVEECKSLMAEGVKLERLTLGAEKESQYTKINILIGGHRYNNELAGDNGEADGEVVWEALEDAERKDFEQLDDAERAAWLTWKNAPKKKLESGDDPQVKRLEP